VSKAFTRESDDAPERPLTWAQPPPLPPGAKNYVTERGAQAMREELNRLVDVERPKVAAIADPTERARQFQAVDHRIQYVERSLRTAVVAPTPPTPWEVVRFGATVTIRDGAGEQSTYRIVGVDEADFDRGWISWCSPVARALLNARKGQRVRFETPDGTQELNIVEIAYE
jgi:transcription elongation factor GreB